MFLGCSWVMSGFWGPFLNDSVLGSNSLIWVGSKIFGLGDRVQCPPLVYNAWKYIILNINLFRTESRDPANTQRKRKISEIATNKLVGDWSAFLNEIFAKVGVSGIDVNDDTIVNAADEKWLGNVNKVSFALD